MRLNKILVYKKSLLNIFFSLLTCLNLYTQCKDSNNLCNKKYNEVAYLTTHNAFNSSQDNFSFPNQNKNIATQLNDGVRGFMIDIYNSGGATIVYHGSSIFGSKPFSKYLGDIKSFLDDNPNEIITIILQNHPDVSANAIENDLNQAGLTSYLHTQNKFSDWPTLQTMIDSNKRLVVFNEVNNASASQSWYHHIWDFAVEINYGKINCDFGRGNPSNKLFVFNHFVTSNIGTGSISEAQKVNSNPYFIDHVTQCKEEKNKFPNFITVDFYDLGDAMEVVNKLNESATDNDDDENDDGNSSGNGSDNKEPKIVQLQKGGKVIVKANASLNLKGLKLTPSEDYVFKSDNNITRSLESLGTGSNKSMARVFNFTSATNNFVGKIKYFYDDVDMGNITHENAVLQVKNETDAWETYVDEDSDNHKITHTFNTPIQLKSITASASTTTLSIDVVDENMKILMYPNPVSTQLTIKYEGDLNTSLFDALGRSVIKTQSKIIDMESLPNGIYILTTKDNSTNKTNSYKVIKK